MTKKVKKLKGLTLQFIPYTEIESLNSSERIKKILGVVLKNNIVVLQGRLYVEEETRLIEDTMALIGHIKNFKGVELAVISPNNNTLSYYSKFKHTLAKALVGDTESLSIIGPASIVKEIKKDPRKIELMLNK